MRPESNGRRVATCDRANGEATRRKRSFDTQTNGFAQLARLCYRPPPRKSKEDRVPSTSPGTGRTRREAVHYNSRRPWLQSRQVARQSVANDYATAPRVPAKPCTISVEPTRLNSCRRANDGFFGRPVMRRLSRRSLVLGAGAAPALGVTRVGATNRIAALVSQLQGVATARRRVRLSRSPPPDARSLILPARTRGRGSGLTDSHVNQAKQCFAPPHRLPEDDRCQTRLRRSHARHASAFY